MVGRINERLADRCSQWFLVSSSLQIVRYVVPNVLYP
jgi:hypothetical protein